MKRRADGATVGGLNMDTTSAADPSLGWPFLLAYAFCLAVIFLGMRRGNGDGREKAGRVTAVKANRKRAEKGFDQVEQLRDFHQAAQESEKLAKKLRKRRHCEQRRRTAHPSN